MIKPSLAQSTVEKFISTDIIVGWPVGHFPRPKHPRKKRKRRTKRSNPPAVGARVAPPRRMPRHRCDYCETTLTHDSVRPREFASCARNPPELNPPNRPRPLSNFGLTPFRPPSIYPLKPSKTPGSSITSGLSTWRTFATTTRSSKRRSTRAMHPR